MKFLLGFLGVALAEQQGKTGGLELTVIQGPIPGERNWALKTVLSWVAD